MRARGDRSSVGRHEARLWPLAAARVGREEAGPTNFSSRSRAASARATSMPTSTLPAASVSSAVNMALSLTTSPCSTLPMRTCSGLGLGLGLG